jgi:hypothetical protein
VRVCLGLETQKEGCGVTGRKCARRPLTRSGINAWRLRGGQLGACAGAASDKGLKVNDDAEFLSEDDTAEHHRDLARRSVFEVHEAEKKLRLLNRLYEVIKLEPEIFLADDVLGKGTALGRASKF